MPKLNKPSEPSEPSEPLTAATKALYYKWRAAVSHAAALEQEFARHLLSTGREDLVRNSWRGRSGTIYGFPDTRALRNALRLEEETNGNSDA